MLLRARGGGGGGFRVLGVPVSRLRTLLTTTHEPPSSLYGSCSVYGIVDTGLRLWRCEVEGRPRGRVA